MTRFHFSSTLLTCLALACGGRSTPETTAPTNEAVDVVELNAPFRDDAFVETLHGTRVADPYRSLELDSPETWAWAEAQSERTGAALVVPEETRAAFAELMEIDRISSVRRAEDRVFFMLREGDAEQPSLYVIEERTRSRLLLDPVARAAELLETTDTSPKIAVDWYYPSPNGDLVAFGVSENGDEKSTLRIIRTATGELLDVAIPRTKWSSIAWMPDGSGFYFTRYPKPGEEHFDAEHEDHYFPSLFYYDFSGGPERFVWGSSDGTDFPSAHVSPDGRYVTINNFRGWSASDVYVFDRLAGTETSVAVPDDEHPIVPVVVGRDSVTAGAVYGEELILFTNEGAPRYRIMSLLVSALGENVPVEAWQVLVGEQDEQTLVDWTVTSDGLVLQYLEGAASVLYRFDRNSRQRAAIDMPIPGGANITYLGGESDRPDVIFAGEGFVEPPGIYQSVGESVSIVQRTHLPIDVSDLVVEVGSATSADGTSVPYTSVSAQNGLAASEMRYLVYGYGGFNISIKPRFSAVAIYWAKNGGTFVSTNLRGGGELGEDWHRAGMLENKERVFEDFEGVLRRLAEGGANPANIGIYGGSNGGLLMGAMLTRSPELFGAAASYVGLYDMVRYHLFPPAELWIAEYGSAEDEAMFPVIHGYSPYHQVQQGVAYPATLIETADSDSRVHWAHSTKFAAALQDATSGEAPIYFLMEQAQGHGAGSSQTDAINKYARMFTFFEQELGE